MILIEEIKHMHVLGHSVHYCNCAHFLADALADSFR